jgi:putative spermidine/putrescine transport system permease protein
MSSSSSDEHVPQLDVQEIEQAEDIVEQRPPGAEAALGEAEEGRQRGGWATTLWAAPGFAFLGFYLVAPLVFIVLVSFWTYKVGARSGFVTDWTFANYNDLLGFGEKQIDTVYWRNMWSSFYRSLIAVAACLVFGFPIAYFLALKVNSLRNQIALFIIALAPFWTSSLTRSVAWTFPLMGREGALNQLASKIGIGSPDNPLIEPLSETSVTLAMIQLYILFMVTPLFFTLSQVDRTALEAARDLGGNSWRTFREVILPQAMPGVVIGSIFVFVLTMGEYGTVRLVGGNAVSSVGTIVNSKVELAVQYPQGAASAVLLVLALILGVFVITRFSNLREEL